MSDVHGAEDLRERSIGELMKKLSSDLSTLMRQELELARAELTQKGKEAGMGAGFIAGAAVFGLLAMGTFTVLVLLVLNAVMKDWLAALIVTLVYGVVAYVLVQRGRQKLKDAGSPVPQQTVETLKEDAQWAKTQI